jgi:hypothetical protein
LLCLALFDDLLNVELGRLRRDMEGRGSFLPIFIDVLLQLNPVSHRDIFPLVDLLLAAAVQLFEGDYAALSKLGLDGV